ncbi:MAG: TraR/DksA C4-type zinc finger protein [Chloroflexota bacterium]|nr:TraR/DksA C4-type zinc finger protein [Chloroflexota bacterium]
MADTAQYRTRIEAERARLLLDLRQRDEEIAESSDPLDPERGGMGNHPADVANDMEEAEKDFGLRENTQQLLAQVDHALARLDAGTYGICENCGKPIPAARLDARPFATLDVDCQEKLESGQVLDTATA